MYVVCLQCGAIAVAYQLAHAGVWQWSDADRRGEDGADCCSPRHHLQTSGEEGTRH